MGPGPRPLYLQMGLTRDKATNEAITFILLLPQLPEQGKDVPSRLTFAKPGQTINFFQQQAAKPDKAHNIDIRIAACCAQLCQG